MLEIILLIGEIVILGVLAYGVYALHCIYSQITSDSVDYHGRFAVIEYNTTLIDDKLMKHIIDKRL